MTWYNLAFFKHGWAYIEEEDRKKPELVSQILQVMGGVGGHHTAAEGRYLMLGNGFLLLNTLAMAMYYLRSASDQLEYVQSLPHH